MIKVVVFDFDGTLVDSNLIKERMFERVVENLPGGLEALNAAKTLGGDRHRIFTEVSKRLTTDVASQRDLTRRLTADYGRRCLRAIANAPERRGASRALAHLRARGLKLYINTATPSADIPALLRCRRWASVFCDALGAPQDKSKILRTIQRIERVTSREMLMIGDSPDDLACARDVGTWFVAITDEERISLRPPFGMRDLRKISAVLGTLKRQVPRSSSRYP